MRDDETPTTTALAAGATLAAHVRGYAAAVRLHLADLGPEVAEDLTGGLEADLTEALADARPDLAAGASGAPDRDDVVLDLARTFGTASSYAAELRAAAGLPPEGPPRGPGLRGRAANRWGRTRERWAQELEPLVSHPRWASVRELAHVLRPAWWLARGWIVGVVVVFLVAGVTGIFRTSDGFSLVPSSGPTFLVMAGCALVSVQWARGRWLPERWLPPATHAATVVAVLALPFVLVATDDLTVNAGSSPYAYDQGYSDAIAAAGPVSYGGDMPGDDGVWVDGMQVSNLFVFDANGDPIRDVQIFDDRGRPVRTVAEENVQYAWEVPQVDGSWYFRPTPADDGHERWNVYPLQALPENAMGWADDGEALEPLVGVKAEDMPWPFLKAPTTITPDGAPSAPPSPAPSADPTPAPPSDPTPAPSSSASPGTTGGTPSDPASMIDASAGR